MNSTPALVLLGAGASSRLSAAAPQDRCKATVDLAGASPVRRLLVAGRSWTEPACAPPPLVVTGHHHAEIAAELSGFCEVDLARNRRWSEGRTGSIAMAIQARRGRDLCLAPVDVPLVPASVFEALLSAWQKAGAPPKGWLAPRISDPARSDQTRSDRFGHPLVLGRELLEELSGWIKENGPDMPLKRLRATASPLLSVPVTSARILDDLDTVSDLAHLRSISKPIS